MKGRNSRLASARKEKGYTQEELANLLDVRKSTVSNWETGYSSPQLTQAIKVADLLDKEVSFLFSIDVQDVHTKQLTKVGG